MECRRGDIYFVDFGRDTESNLQCGIRPALVVSNNRANENSPVITVIPLTARTYKRPHFPTHVDSEDLRYRACQKQHGAGRAGQHH